MRYSRGERMNKMFMSGRVYDEDGSHDLIIIVFKFCLRSF